MTNEEFMNRINNGENLEGSGINESSGLLPKTDVYESTEPAAEKTFETDPVTEEPEAPAKMLDFEADPNIDNTPDNDGEIDFNKPISATVDEAMDAVNQPPKKNYPIRVPDDEVLETEISPEATDIDSDPDFEVVNISPADNVIADESKKIAATVGQIVEESAKPVKEEKNTSIVEASGVHLNTGKPKKKVKKDTAVPIDLNIAKKKKKKVNVVPIVIGSLIIALGVGFAGYKLMNTPKTPAETPKSAYENFVIDTNATDEAKQAPNTLASRNVYFAGIDNSVCDSNTIVYLENLPDNEDFMMKYQIYIIDEDGVKGSLIYETDLIPSGQHVDWKPSETLEPGEYTLAFDELPFMQSGNDWIPLTAGENQVILTILK